MDSRYSTHIYWDEEEKYYVATCAEFPFLSGVDESKSKAVKILEEAIEASLEMLGEGKLEAPVPITLPEYSGNIRLRLPKSLHKSLAEMAECEGVSLNQYMVQLLARFNEKNTVHNHYHLNYNLRGSEEFTDSIPEIMASESTGEPKFRKVS